RLTAFVEQQTNVSFDIKSVTPEVIKVHPHPSTNQAVFDTLVLGVRDYVTKNGFSGVVLGLSGGIDSALTLVVAVEALGAENVEAIMLPTRYTSDMSLQDAELLAENLSVDYRSIEIEPAFETLLSMLSDEFAGTEVDATEENLQARIRGVVLMAISNKKGKMVLTTGNKSEMAVGYSTLYGDMAGGYDVLKDVPKTLVFEISRYCNRDQEVIPLRIIERPPSAELRDDQTDQDSLPDYDELDAILDDYVEKEMSIDKIIARGHDADVVAKVARMVDINEYKRRQSPPGVRITPKAFGRDRRYPITSGFVDKINKA
ncbi:MAG: NAD+ synthase, partial [Gammaproteobacteria bacterium]|nr:NAD+ synthase [Gammaproteobacteria bacterium]